MKDLITADEAWTLETKLRLRRDMIEEREAIAGFSPTDCTVVVGDDQENSFATAWGPVQDVLLAEIDAAIERIDQDLVVFGVRVA